MNGINKVILIGNLTRDPDARATANGESVTNITIACNESYKDKSGQKVERAEFVQIVFFGRLAEIASEYLKKGALVYVEGSIRTEKYQKDGQDRYTTKVMGWSMQMLGGKGQGGERQQARDKGNRSAQPAPFDNFDEDIF